MPQINQYPAPQTPLTGTEAVPMVQEQGTGNYQTVTGTTGQIARFANSGVNGPYYLPKYTVETLPVGTLGMLAFVTDATAPTFLGALTGGGTVATPAFYNGSAWVAV